MTCIYCDEPATVRALCADCDAEVEQMAAELHGVHPKLCTDRHDEVEESK